MRHHFRSDIFLYIMANLVISKIAAFEGQALGMVLGCGTDYDRDIVGILT